MLYHHSLADIETTLNSLISTDIIEKIILVDNGGCDWASQLDEPNIDYISAARNGGFGYGHNQAINEYAQLSDYFLVCNPDIDFEPEQLRKLHDIAQRSQAGLFSPKIIYPDGSNQFGQRLLPTPLNLFARRFLPKCISNSLDDKYLLRNITFNEPVLIPNISGSFMLFKSECLVELGGFDERYFMYMEDIDLSRRFAKRFGALYIPEVCVVHEHQQASYHNKTMLKAHIISAIKYFNKWGWVFDRERSEMNRKVLDKIKF